MKCETDNENSILKIIITKNKVRPNFSLVVVTYNSSFVYHLYTSVSTEYTVKQYLPLSLFNTIACLNSHDPQQSSEFMQKKAAEDMRADIQRKCLWSPLKKQQWVNSVWTLQLLDHENLQHRHCLIIPKENKGNSCSLQQSWHTETERDWVSEREREPKKQKGIAFVL